MSKYNDEYNQQAVEFLTETGTKLDIRFIKRGYYFYGDKETRNIFRVILSREVDSEHKEYSFTFGDSIMNTDKPGINYPSDYDILACLNIWGGTNIKDFCDEFGYELIDYPETTQDRENNTMITSTYKKVMEQDKGLRSLYYDKELEQLNEIN